MKEFERKFKIEASEGTSITDASLEIADDGNSVVVTMTEEVERLQRPMVNGAEFDEVFPIFWPHELIGHPVRDYKPETQWEQDVMAILDMVGTEKLPPFRAPFVGPSEDEDYNIFFAPGNNNDVVRDSAKGYQRTWEEMNCRSGTELHLAVFLGTMAMHLVDEEGYSVREAWKTVGGLYSQDTDFLKMSKYVVKYGGSEYLIAHNGCQNRGFLAKDHYPNSTYCNVIGWPVMDA